MPVARLTESHVPMRMHIAFEIIVRDERAVCARFTIGRNFFIIPLRVMDTDAGPGGAIAPIPSVIVDVIILRNLSIKE